MTDTDILISWKTPSALNHTPVTCYKVQMGYIGKYIFNQSAFRNSNFQLIPVINDVQINESCNHFQIIIDSIFISYLQTLSKSTEDVEFYMDTIKIMYLCK